MNSLCEGALGLLERVYRDDIASFPFTTYLPADAAASVYQHSRTLRSTVNCLLGLRKAEEQQPSHPFLQRVDGLVDLFVALHEQQVDNLGDLGLLVVLLCERDRNRAATRRVLGRLIEQTGDEALVRRQNVQDLTWLLWGCLAACRRGLGEAEPVAHLLFGVLRARYHRTGDALPRHDLHRLRAPVVSFGASVYFVHSVYLYGQTFTSPEAMTMFRGGVTALLSCQREGGEWPWLLSCKDGRPLDVYPVFSVHQHSMAMFALFPAEKEGFPGVGEAVKASLSWMSGTNQLGTPMIREDPFFTFRSIERRAAWPRALSPAQGAARAQRYVGACARLVTRREASLVPNDRVTINTECRSYELGWALYLLSDQPSLPGLG